MLVWFNLVGIGFGCGRRLLAAAGSELLLPLITASFV
jgi:hypothetical protein